MSGDAVDEAANVPPTDYALLLRIRGNLRHRIQRLGTETDANQLIESQKTLRRIAKQMPFGAPRKVHFDGPRTVLDRPGWANGAFVYLSAEHCKGIEKAIRDAGVQLQSKHLLVSPEYKHVVKEVFDASPEAADRTGRKLFRRAAVIDAEEKIYLPCKHSSESDCYRDAGVQLQSKHLLVSPEYKHVVKEVVDASPEAADRTGRRGFLVRRDGVIDAKEKIYLPCKHCYDTDWYRDLCGFSSYDPSEWQSPCTCDASSQSMASMAYNMEAGHGRRGTNAMFLQLNNDLMEQRHIDMDPLEYLTSPPSVQRLNLDMWINAWEHVCEENWWMEMRRRNSCPWPYCTLCDKWAERLHLTSVRCTSKRKGKDVKDGPLLSAILAAEEVVRHTSWQRFLADVPPPFQDATENVRTPNALDAAYSPNYS